MNKKYFFFDIDGTLTDNQTKQIVPSAQLALQKLEEAGHFVSIATGRAHYKARNVMESIGLSNMVCSGGAGLVYNHVLIENNPLDKQKAITVLEEAEQLGIGFLVAIDDSIACYSKDDCFREQVGERQEDTTYHINPLFDYHNVEHIYKIYLALPITQEHLLTSKSTLGHLRYVQEYLMFQHDAKQIGIQNMMQYLQADIKDVVVFGDDYNDLVMFTDDWYCIAMGNACDALKEKADYVCDSNVNDGIYKACIHHGWIQD